MNDSCGCTGEIAVYSDGIPDDMKGCLELVKTYDVRQGARGKKRGWERLNDEPSGVALASYEIEAKEESISDELRDKALGMAIEQIIKRAMKDGIDVAAISDPRITSSWSQVREDSSYYRQAALTIEVEADVYKKKSDDIVGERINFDASPGTAKI